MRMCRASFFVMQFHFFIKLLNTPINDLDFRMNEFLNKSLIRNFKKSSPIELFLGILTSSPLSDSIRPLVLL